MLRSDYCSDYERQKSEFQNSIATIVATTPFKTDLNGQSSAKASIRKRKLKSLSSLAPPFGGASGSRRLAARAQASRFGTKTQLAGRTLTPTCRLRAEKGAPCGRINIICIFGWMRTNAPRWKKGLQASGLPLSAYLRKLILGESIQAAPSEELRRLRTGDPSDRQQHQPACAESERRVCQP